MPASRSPATFRGRRVDLVVDVRSRLEFWMGHLDGAICVPAHRVAERLATDAELGRDACILVYCASGARSAMAAGTLRAAGFRNVMDGGGLAAAARDFAAGA